MIRCVGHRTVLIAPFALAACSPLRSDDSISSVSDTGEQAAADRRNPSDVEAGPTSSDGPSAFPDASLADRADADSTTDDGGDAAAADQRDGADDTSADVSTEGEPGSADADTSADASAGDDADAPGAPTCVPDCPALGAFRCAPSNDASPSRQLQVCSRAASCLQWLDTATCAADQICCAGQCQSSAAPSVCDVAPTGYDFYVATPSAAPPPPTFTTISAAIAAASASPLTSPRIYVGPGHYDASSGELFPLILRGGVSLYGAGADRVVIQGAGLFDHHAAGGVDADFYYPTLVVGDETETTVISGITIRSDTPTPLARYEGLFCDRGGNPSPQSTGLTIVDHAVIGPGYNEGIAALNSTAPKAIGCNLRVTNSTIIGNAWGIHAAGCRPEDTTGTPVYLQIGDSSGPNTFFKNGNEYDNTGAILMQGCVTNSSVRNSAFIAGSYGIYIDQWGDPQQGDHPFIIDNNTFTQLTNAAIILVGMAPSLEELNDNTFSGGHGAVMGTTPIPALSLCGGPLLPLVKKARRNHFVGNDIGVGIGCSASADFGSTSTIDFGRPDDPGGNEFRCNSSSLGGGGDLVINLPATGVIPFAGNAWDHSPPTQGITGSTAYNGIDISFFDDQPPSVDTSSSAVDTSPCPDGGVP